MTADSEQGLTNMQKGNEGLQFMLQTLCFCGAMLATGLYEHCGGAYLTAQTMDSNCPNGLVETHQLPYGVKEFSCS
jgi:hypothetical protein